MVGKGALVMVVGFGVIMGYILLDMSHIVTRSAEGMVGYNQLLNTREAASSGVQIGLAMLARNREILAQQTSGVTLANLSPTSGSFRNMNIEVTLGPEIATGGSSDTVQRVLRSVSKYALPLVDIFGDVLHISDTVYVTLQVLRRDPSQIDEYENKFSHLAWMTITEGDNIWFVTGDTLYGKSHSNGDIRVMGRPVFMERITTSGRLIFQNYDSSRDSSAVFRDGYEQNVTPKDFPNDLSRLWNNATNSDTTSILYVDLRPGTSADGDGSVVIRRNSFSGPVVDSISLTGRTNTVVYSRERIFVRGTLDGRLSIASRQDIIIADDIRYERSPDETGRWNGQETDDLLGLIAERNVTIADNQANDKNDLYLEACIFARTGSYGAENYATRGKEGRIYLKGSIAQNTRGAVGTTSGSGYLKSYRHDVRLKNPRYAPPFFPGYYDSRIINGVLAAKIINWWESVPRDQGKYFVQF